MRTELHTAGGLGWFQLFSSPEWFAVSLLKFGLPPRAAADVGDPQDQSGVTGGCPAPGAGDISWKRKNVPIFAAVF